MHVRFQPRMRGADDFAGARMNWKHDPLVERVEGVQNARQPAWIVGVLAAVHRHEQVIPFPQAEPLQNVWRVRSGSLSRPVQHVEHDVPDQVDVFGDPFGRQVRHRRVARAQQHRRQMVGDDAVDLLRHAAIEAAESCFNVGDWHGQLRSGQRPSQRGICIAVDQKIVGTFGEQDVFDACEHGAGLTAV